MPNTAPLPSSASITLSFVAIPVVAGGGAGRPTVGQLWPRGSGA
jgi:hypothetical protein